MTATAENRDTALEDALVARFLRYSAITSQSDASATTVPTTEGQRELAELLCEELIAAGAQDVHLSDTAVLTARIPANLPNGHAPVDPIGLCAHLDTVDAGHSPEVHAQLIVHTGGDVLLNAEQDIWLRAAEHPEIDRYIGDRILVTDGTSVLGADDKAGLATVMETAARLLADQDHVHGDIYLAIVPDEEIGLRGVRTLDLDRFPVSVAYTIDSPELGEVVEETFNAATAVLTVTGVTAHPIAAKGILVNPILIAAELIGMLDPLETPEHTEGREPYIWVNDIAGDQAEATVTISIRDHDLEGYDEKKQRLAAHVERLREAHPRARIELAIQDVYGNIADARTPQNEHALKTVYQALENLGIEAKPTPMRGGTDGSYLSTQGIFTPNIFTGAHNFHSVAEFLPLGPFAQSFRVVQEVIRLTTGLTTRGPSGKASCRSCAPRRRDTPTWPQRRRTLMRLRTIDPRTLTLSALSHLRSEPVRMRNRAAPPRPVRLR